jgi:putative protease
MSAQPLLSEIKKVELLMPAQNLKSLKAVVNKADAVYFGAESLNMRMNADNFSLDDLPQIVEFCHDNNLRAYLATNVIVYENELKMVKDILEKAKMAGIDAIILHDMAVLELAREIGLKIHISTQASISNSRSAKFYSKLGAERIILARELSLEAIKQIAIEVPELQIETFIHGAMCTSISGRCYFSPVVCEDPQVSANRGKCTQPCRSKWRVISEKGVELDYDGVYFLNSKDLCMIEYIPELINAGIKSLKVEGRMRDPHYMEVVAGCYREAIDDFYNGTFSREKAQKWVQHLNSVYNRGFSTGFYFQRPGLNEITVDGSGNMATDQKIQIGRVTAYFKGAQAAKIELYQDSVKIGDDIFIEGGKMGTFLHQKVTSMQIKKKAVVETPPINPGASLIIGISVDYPVKEGDRVYIYRKREKNESNLAQS